MTHIYGECVEEARLIHEDVFVELTKPFPCDFQLHRLLLLENVRSWLEWHQISEQMKAADDWQKHLYMMDFIKVNIFMKKSYLNKAKCIAIESLKA